MNIVAHNHQSRELLSSKISRFLEEFHVGRILKACNAYKVRGFSVKDIFQVAFENAFSSKSFFQKQRESSMSIPYEFQQHQLAQIHITAILGSYPED